MCAIGLLLQLFEKLKQFEIEFGKLIGVVLFAFRQHPIVSAVGAYPFDDPCKSRIVHYVHDGSATDTFAIKKSSRRCPQLGWSACLQRDEYILMRHFAISKSVQRL